MTADAPAAHAPPLSDDPGASVAPGVPVAVPIHDGELVILNLRPHPIYILLSSLGWALALTVIGLPLALLASNPASPFSRAWVVSLCIGAFLLRLLWQTLDWWCRSYILTDRRVIAAAGVVRRARFEAPLRTIQNVGMQQSVLERIFAIGTISFATAGTAGWDALWLSVDRPGEVLRIVRETIDRYGGPTRTAP